jgi:TonB family protein
MTRLKEEVRATSAATRPISRRISVCLVVFVAVCFPNGLAPLHAAPANAPGPVARPKALYTPAPVYRPEWARQGLAGKGVVLITIDPETGKVTGARMLQSTGSKLLDGSALQAYSQWRFAPGTVPQLKMPIEFAPRPNALRPNAAPIRPAKLYPVLILVVVAVIMMALFKRRER